LWKWWRDYFGIDGEEKRKKLQMTGNLVLILRLSDFIESYGLR
jgi:hypothetical protein